MAVGEVAHIACLLYLSPGTLPCVLLVEAATIWPRFTGKGAKELGAMFKATIGQCKTV